MLPAMAALRPAERSCAGLKRTGLGPQATLQNFRLLRQLSPTCQKNRTSIGPHLGRRKPTEISRGNRLRQEVWKRVNIFQRTRSGRLPCSEKGAANQRYLTITPDIHE